MITNKKLTMIPRTVQIARKTTLQDIVLRNRTFPCAKNRDSDGERATTFKLVHFIFMVAGDCVAKLAKQKLSNYNLNRV